MDVMCKTCTEKMQRKINVDDIVLHWCPTCGTCRLLAPDIEGFIAWWVPLREGLQALGRKQ